MRASIVAADNIVVVDGVSLISDCSALLADGVSAVQWYNDKGEVEHVGHVLPNKAIDDLSPYQIYIDQAVPLKWLTPEETLANHEEWRRKHPEEVAAWDKYLLDQRSKMLAEAIAQAEASGNEELLKFLRSQEK
jgi:hypothetical protein